MHKLENILVDWYDYIMMISVRNDSNVMNCQLSRKYFMIYFATHINETSAADKMVWLITCARSDINTCGYVKLMIAEKYTW